jgi:hypothetical protein
MATANRERQRLLLANPPYDRIITICNPRVCTLSHTVALPFSCTEWYALSVLLLLKLFTYQGYVDTCPYYYMTEGACLVARVHMQCEWKHNWYLSTHATVSFNIMYWHTHTYNTASPHWNLLTILMFMSLRLKEQHLFIVTEGLWWKKLLTITNYPKTCTSDIRRSSPCA